MRDQNYKMRVEMTALLDCTARHQNMQYGIIGASAAVGLLTKRFVLPKTHFALPLALALIGGGAGAYQYQQYTQNDCITQFINRTPPAEFPLAAKARSLSVHSLDAPAVVLSTC